MSPVPEIARPRRPGYLSPIGTSPDTIKRLVDRFGQQSDVIRTDAYNETQVRIDYIDPMMAELGWDMRNQQGFAEQYREVVHEDRVKVGRQTKAPDYSFRIGNQRKFFLEAKKPAVNVKTDIAPAYQLRAYGWSAKLAVSLLTDFEEFAVYDTRKKPAQLDKASEARREYFRYTDYEARWDFLENTFSKAAVYRGDFDRYCQTSKGRGVQAVDDAFLDEIEGWRKLLANNLALRNLSLGEPDLNFATQKILDRVIFLRIAEDRGTEDANQLLDLAAADDVYPALVKLFRRADERYNSGLFHFDTHKDRAEGRDALTPTLHVDDKTLRSIIRGMYFPQSPYAFEYMPADILGSVYERFLGKVITLTPGHRASVEEKPEVRKAGGVYYTPTYIVDYIVQHTVGKLLGVAPSPSGEGRGEGASIVKSLSPSPDTPGEGRGEGSSSPPAQPSFSPRAAPALKILDPACGPAACGPGSFLIGAYQYLLDWYLKQYTTDDTAAAKLVSQKNAPIRPALLKLVPGSASETIKPGYALTIAERKRLLLDHIHGVDLDSQAVEVTKLNLLLKCLEGETAQTLGFEGRLFRERALPDLGKNLLARTAPIPNSLDRYR